MYNAFENIDESRMNSEEIAEYNFNKWIAKHKANSFYGASYNGTFYWPQSPKSEEYQKNIDDALDILKKELNNIKHSEKSIIFENCKYN